MRSRGRLPPRQSLQRVPISTSASSSHSPARQARIKAQFQLKFSFQQNKEHRSWPPAGGFPLDPETLEQMRGNGVTGAGNGCSISATLYAKCTFHASDKVDDLTSTPELFLPPSHHKHTAYIAPKPLRWQLVLRARPPTLVVGVAPTPPLHWRLV